MACSNQCGAQPHTLSPSTVVSPPSSITEAISQLQASWHTLHLVDRAYALEPLIKAGVKGRHLARELNCNEGLIRFYLSGLAASDADIELARRNGISYSELVRRATGRGSRVESSCEQVQLTEPTMERRIPFADATTILSWLRYDPARECSARLILQEAIRTVAAAERTGRLASLAVPTGVNADQVIESCRPDPDSFDIEVAWYAVWLGRWVVRLIPEADLRCDALNMALERVRTEKNPELW